MSDKKHRELFKLERFISDLFTEKPKAVSQPEPPFPDIVLDVSGRQIGIEITDLILNEDAVLRESGQDLVLKEAQKLYEDQCQLPLHVTVSFAETANWKRINRQKVGTFLADTVIKYVSEVKELPQYQTTFNIKLDEIDHEYINGISMFYLDRLTIPCWSPIGSFWIPQAPVQVIQSIIHRKNKNVNGYLTGCDEVWLLIIETGSPSSYYEQYSELQKVEFESGFARTLIGRISKGELLELRTKPHEI